MAWQQRCRGLFGTWPERRAGSVTNRVDDNLITAYFVKDKIRVRRDGETTNAWTIRAGADKGMKRQDVDDRPDPRLNAFGSLRRMGGDVIEDRAKIGERRKRVAQL